MRRPLSSRGKPRRSKTQRARRKTGLALLLALATGCSSASSTSQQQPEQPAPRADCPRELARRAAHTTPAVAVTVLVDRTASVQADEVWAGQFNAIAGDAVVKGAAVRVVLMSSGAAALQVVLDCPTLQPQVNDPKAAAAQLAAMTKAAGPALLTAAKTPLALQGKGSDVVGSVLATATLPARAPQTLLIALTDGAANVKAVDAPPNALRGVHLGMFGIGRRANTPDPSVETSAATDRLKAWAAAAGDPAAVVTPLPYTSGALIGATS